MTLYAGTSGFSYPGWRGVFYPERLPGSRMLAYYAERLNGVELNGTFYRTPAPASLAGWAAQVPPSFRFSCKGHRGLTYSAAAFDKEGLARDTAVRLGALHGRLGPVLLQWPPTRERDPGLLDRLLTALGLTAAVEFRHPSWFCEAVYEVLRAHGAALVRTDGERWPPAPAAEVGPVAYYRLRRDYDLVALRRWRRELRAEAAGREALHVYFRHDPQGPARAAFMLE
jgi:uncharacterized protein YecE (DUF72 family)